jgi:Divergent InlB B-repeat domain
VIRRRRDSSSIARSAGRGPFARLPLAAAGALLALALLAAPASAAPTQKTCEEVGGSNAECFDGAETPAGEMEPAWDAVDESTGDVYVIDTVYQVVDRFSKDGRYLGRLVADKGTPAERFGRGPLAVGAARGDIAVDNSGGPTQGYVYVLGGDREGFLTAFDAAGNFRWQIVPTLGGAARGVAIDASGDLWIADSAAGVQQRSQVDGAAIGGFYHGFHDEGDIDVTPEWMAFDSTGVAYTANSGGRVYRFSPDIVTGTKTFLEAGAHDIAVDPVTHELYANQISGLVDVYDSAGGSVAASIGTGTIAGVTVDGSHGYAFFSEQSESGGTVEIWARGSGSPQPYVRTGSASEVSGTAATLNGIVDPAGEATTCSFQYVDDAQFQVDGFASAASQACAADPGAGNGEAPASAVLGGLSPETEYHYRLIASNGAGATNGSAGAFTAGAQIRTLTVSASGSGSVSADQGAIAGCSASGGTCSDGYPEGTTVTLTASPGANQRIASWTGCDSTPGGPTGSSCQVELSTADAQVSVVFTRIMHTLTIAVAGSGDGSVRCNRVPWSCARRYPQGMPVQLAAVPDAGSVFAGFSGGGCPPTGPCSIDMQSDTTITATFETPTPAVERVQDHGQDSGAAAASSAPGTTAREETHKPTYGGRISSAGEAYRKAVKAAKHRRGRSRVRAIVKARRQKAKLVVRCKRRYGKKVKRHRARYAKRHHRHHHGGRRGAGEGGESR